jgi:hypothetical protein
MLSSWLDVVLVDEKSSLIVRPPASEINGVTLQFDVSSE